MPKSTDITSFIQAYDKGAVVIDVREPDEYEAGHVPGAKLIPLGELRARTSEIDRHTTTYVMCGGGARGVRAAEELEEAGYDDVLEVDGGLTAWVAAGRDVEVGPALPEG